jgi:BRCT domain type II-containing protein
MSIVPTKPGMLPAVGADLGHSGSDLVAANIAAAAQQTSLPAASSDVVSAAKAARFPNNAQASQANVPVGQSHDQFVHTLQTSRPAESNAMRSLADAVARAEWAVSVVLSAMAACGVPAARRARRPLQAVLAPQAIQVPLDHLAEIQ